MSLDRSLRGCDLVKSKLPEVVYGSSFSSKATVLQQKTCNPVKLDIIKVSRGVVIALIKLGNLHGKGWLIEMNYHFSGALTLLLLLAFLL